MKKLLFILAMQIIWVPSFSQVILDHQVISSTGSYNNTGSINASSTTGEVVVGTSITANLVVTQGFQQPLPTDIIIGMKNVEPEGIKINVYPNPTMDMVTVEFSLSVAIKIVIDTYNEAGQLIFAGNELNVENHSKQQLDFSRLSAGDYFIHIKSTDGTINQCYKVLKRSN